VGSRRWAASVRSPAAGLSFALVLEHMAFLNISFNARNNLPWRSGWNLMGPTGQ
jgi:8-hydroxy-5-deazaflavin:NADPH oxidoreductase